MCGKIMTVLLIFVALNCSVARYSGRLHSIVGVLPTCYKRKAATYFYPPGGTGQALFGGRNSKLRIQLHFSAIHVALFVGLDYDSFTLLVSFLAGPHSAVGRAPDS